MITINIGIYIITFVLFITISTIFVKKAILFNFEFLLKITKKEFARVSHTETAKV